MPLSVPSPLHGCRKLRILSGLLLLCASWGPASAKPPGVAAPPANMVKTMPEKPLVDPTPSRLVSESALQAYLQSVSSQFTIQHQATDPFGLYQDPNAKPVIKKSVAKVARRAAPAQVTPFADVIRLLQIHTVIPREKRFLIDSMTLREGELLSIRHRGRLITAKIVSVSSSRILFQNTASNETASLSLNLMPAGMAAGHDAITAPGLIPSRQSNLIELDPGIHSEDDSPTPAPPTP